MPKSAPEIDLSRYAVSEDKGRYRADWLALIASNAAIATASDMAAATAWGAAAAVTASATTN